MVSSHGPDATNLPLINPLLDRWEADSKLQSRFAEFQQLLTGALLGARFMTRCIEINMERLRPGEHVQDFDELIVEPRAAKLKERCARWAEQNISGLLQARPESPPGIRNRSREVSRPLFAVGDAAGGRWAKLIRDAVSRIFQVQATEPSTDIRIELLRDVREAFGDTEKIASADLVKLLVEMGSGPVRPGKRKGQGQATVAATQSAGAANLRHGDIVEGIHPGAGAGAQLRGHGLAASFIVQQRHEVVAGRIRKLGLWPLVPLTPRLSACALRSQTFSDISALRRHPGR
jgi:uncharacterized protein DUF3631